MPYNSFELLLDSPELAIALVDGTLYASTVHAEASADELLIAAAGAAAHGPAAPQQLPPLADLWQHLKHSDAPEIRQLHRPKLTPLDWTPPNN